MSENQTPVETDINTRWEQGMDHHPESIRIFQILKAADWEYGGDYFCWKNGGDGDNGETLMFMLDVYFEVQANAPVSGGTPSAPVDCSASRTCLSCGRQTCDRQPEDHDPEDCKDWKPNAH